MERDTIKKLHFYFSIVGRKKEDDDKKKKKKKKPTATQTVQYIHVKPQHHQQAEQQVQHIHLIEDDHSYGHDEEESDEVFVQPHGHKRPGHKIGHHGGGGHKGGHGGNIKGRDIGGGCWAVCCICA